MDINSYIDQFEQQGATLSYPVLNEGNYKANISAITCRYNKVVPKKGPNQGKEIVITNWGVKLELDSQTAQEVMKRDGDVIVYADQDTQNLGKASLDVAEGIGVTFDNNINLWQTIGSIFSQVGLATKIQDDSGASTYKLDRGILEGIYNGTQELEQKLLEDSEVEASEIPAKLAEHQINNISELICSESDTRRCYVHIARRKNWKDSTRQEHYVKQIILPEVFEATEENMASLVL